MKTTGATFGILTNRTSQTSATTEPLSGRRPILAPLMRMLWAAALALPVLGAQAGAVLTTLYSFTGTNDGGGPTGLVQGSDGNFYGTTGQGGGTHTNGTVFKISPNGALTSLYSFKPPMDGANPEAALVQGSDGNFYGTTYGGGAGGAGTVFRLTVAGAAPAFQPVGLANGTLSLTWSTEAGGTYQLQCNSDLSSTNWTNLGSPATATGATLSATDPVTNGPPRLYRVVLLP